MRAMAVFMFEVNRCSGVNAYSWVIPIHQNSHLKHQNNCFLIMEGIFWAFSLCKGGTNLQLLAPGATLHAELGWEMGHHLGAFTLLSAKLMPLTILFLYVLCSSLGPVSSEPPTQAPQRSAAQTPSSLISIFLLHTLSQEHGSVAWYGLCHPKPLGLLDSDAFVLDYPKSILTQWSIQLVKDNEGKLAAARAACWPPRFSLFSLSWYLICTEAESSRVSDTFVCRKQRKPWNVFQLTTSPCLQKMKAGGKAGGRECKLPPPPAESSLCRRKHLLLISTEKNRHGPWWKICTKVNRNSAGTHSSLASNLPSTQGSVLRKPGQFLGSVLLDHGESGPSLQLMPLP